MDDRLERIGVITDAHANLPATMAALAAMVASGCELIVHTGDAIGIGPHPREVLDLLLSRSDVTCLMGNHDELFASDLLKDPPSYLGSGELEHQKWTQAQLQNEHRENVAEWPYIYDLMWMGVSFRFLHYARSEERFSPISKNNDPLELDQMFQPTSDIVFFGHHHPRCDVQGNARYINPGALGTNPGQGARYALISKRRDGVEISHHAVGYEAESVRQDLLKRDVPEADFILNVFLKD